MIDLVFVTNVPAPYKYSRFEALAALEAVDLSVYYANGETGRHQYDFRDSSDYSTHQKQSFRLELGDTELFVDTWSFSEFLTIDADIFVVGGWNYSAAWAAITAGRLRNIPVAVISANVDTGNSSTRWPIKYGLKFADTFLALSSSAAKDLNSLDIPPDRISILPNSIDIESFRDSLSAEAQATIRSKYSVSDRFFILYVGNLERSKGVSDLIRATDNIPETFLMIVGDGPERSTLEKLAGERLNNSVIFTGWIENTKLANYYGAADAFCLPTYNDTWGLVLNEALACETPAITTTAAGAAGDLVIDSQNGLIFTPGDITSLQDAVRQLKQDKKLRQSYASQGSKDVEMYTPERYAEELLDVLENIV